jgi:molecular chaperone GrpE
MVKNVRKQPDAPDDAPVVADTDESGETAGGAEVALQAERDELHDRLLRTAAEFDNYRKRVDRERRDQAEQATTDLLLEILALADDFDRALTVEATGPVGAYRRGVELIHSKLHELLQRHNVRPMDVVGQDFDPLLHQAVMHEPSEEHRDGEIIQELRRGYMRGDRLLRPAMVKVAKA